MSSVRDEITQTLQRLGRRIAAQAGLQPARSYVDPSRPVLPPLGTEFGPYRILRRLGAGGMGQVYLATDTRLDRQVALKFLSADVAADPIMLRRLQAEARTASALNHPNILTIHEIGERDGRHFIASEYIEGRTLRAAMQAEPLDLAETIDVSCQVVSALVAAHQAGIVHRDLKPGNIMIRPDGYVKVIDFGLAKRTVHGDLSRLTASLTQPGLIVGTVYYMSPEQARGEPVDHRTDIWSLGIILFELLAGHRPFEGRSESHVIVQILDEPLPDLPAGRLVPPELLAVLQRALAKDAADRYSSARELLRDLTAVPLDRPVSETWRTTQPLQRGRSSGRALRSVDRVSFVWVAAAALLLLLGGWWAARSRHWFGPPALQLEMARQLTFSGLVQTQRISPDGKYLAYVTGTADGYQTLYLKQIGTGAEQQRLPPQQTNYAGITFAPDSQSLYIVQKDKDLLGRLYNVPLLGGGRLRTVLTDIDGPITFSPDGTEFAFIRYANEPAKSGQPTRSLLMVARSDGSNIRQRQSKTGDNLLKRVAWSPTADRIAAVGTRENSLLSLHLIEGNGAVRTYPLPGWRAPSQPLWYQDSGLLLVTAAAGIENQPQIRSIDVTNGHVQSLTHDLSGYSELSATGDATTVTAKRREAQAHVWVSEPGSTSFGTSFGAEDDSYPSLSWLDGGHLVVNARRDRYPNLWLLDLETQSRDKLTEEPSVEQSAAVIPGTRSVVLVSNRSGGYHLWRFDNSNNSYQQLTYGSNFDERPTVSPDGQWIYYTSWQSNQPHLYRIRAAGGPALLVSDFPAKDVQVSPDGTRLLFYSQNPQTHAWSVAVAPNGPFPLTHETAMPLSAAHTLYRWSPDGQSVVTVITDRRTVSNVWQVPIDGSGHPRQITAFDDGVITDLTWSPDGTRLACLRVNQGSDAVLFSVSRRE